MWLAVARKKIFLQVFVDLTAQTTAKHLTNLKKHVPDRWEPPPSCNSEDLELATPPPAAQQQGKDPEKRRVCKQAKGPFSGPHTVSHVVPTHFLSTRRGTAKETARFGSGDRGCCGCVAGGGLDLGGGCGWRWLGKKFFCRFLSI